MKTYQEWFKEHGEMHANLVKRLKSEGLNKEEIIQYFDFENMTKHEKDYCVMLEKNKKCHEMETLNCFLCACPYFRFNNNGIKEVEGKTQYSYCSINSKDGSLGTYGEKIHQNCANCTVPHREKFVKKNYNEDWFVPMAECDETES